MGFRIEDLKFRVRRVQGLGFVGFIGFIVFRGSGFVGLRVKGLGFRVS